MRSWVKAMVSRCLGHIAAGANGVSVRCMIGFARIAGLSAGRPWMLPVTLLLLPIGLLLVFVGGVAYAVGFAAGVPVWEQQGAYVSSDPEGIRLRSISGVTTRILPWQSVSHIRLVFRGPFWLHEAVLTSGERVLLDFLDDVDALQAMAKDRDIAIVRSPPGAANA